ncbi:glycosyltransferase family 2 protein [Natrialba swarupiae]|uniref:Glycosyltransferase family 2 protein n=1 Tax=Natrialba swarupiae TaxID=2448032 RepID=A0A5D5AMB7_9EURY|nr:glycosyltransferase family 2 protein [Natrialba swarupiae]TYT62007.1 glycosyltransferase family 2 protein [Natrialba swarupiae]
MAEISVIIPSYNSASLLPRAIDSVLNQTYDDFELIVVDDASDDHTEQVVSAYDDDRIEYIKHDVNRGGSAARNTGIRRSNGKYIAFLDADDEWLPEKLERQLDELESRPDEYVAVHCDRTYETTWSEKLRDRLSVVVGTRKKGVSKEGGEELIQEILLMNLSTGASTLFVKGETVENIGGFDADFPRHQDWEFLIRILQEGKLAHVEDELVIKHHTGEPDPDVFVEGKDKLLSVFSEEISELESRGYEITHVQQHHLAKMYVESGQIGKGLTRIEWSTLELPEVLGVFWSISVGIRTRLTGFFS